MYYPRLRTKNFSCEFLKPGSKNIGPFSVRSLIRFGSTTPVEKIFFKKVPFIEINSIKAIETSRNKLLMKQAFASVDIPQSEWYIYKPILDRTASFLHLNGEIPIIHNEDINFPLVAKRIYGYKGIGMVKIDSQEQLETFIKNTNLTGYYFEKFYNYAREYRFHATQEKVFLRWRKLRTQEAEERWFFNNSNCNWIGESNELFALNEELKARIDIECVKAISAVGLDIGAIDVRVQSKESKTQNFIVLEVNSAPRMGNTSNTLYAKEITTLITEKIKNNNLYEHIEV